MSDIYARADEALRLPLRECRNDDGSVTYHLPAGDVPQETKRLEVCLEFLSARAGMEGYYIVPCVSSCFLMKFISRENTECEVTQHLMTMFGAKLGDEAKLVVTETMRFDYCLRAVVKDGKYTLSMVYDLTKIDLYEDIVLRVYPLTGEEADYNGVARKYRQFQEQKLRLVPLAERAKREPEIAYALDNMPIIRIRMGWKPVPTQVPEQTPENEPPMHVACTFEQVEELMEAMKRQGIEKAELCLVGWNRKGHDGRWPQVFPVEPALGGEEGLKKLTAHAERLGYRIVCHTNNSDAYSVADCWNPEDIIRKKDGSMSVNNVYWSGGRMYNLCPRMAYEKYQPADYERMQDLGFHGFHYIDVLTVVSPRSCFHKDHPLNAEQTVGYINKILARARAQFGGAASEGGFDFAAENLDYALYVGFNLIKGRLPVADEVIPLWQLVYHGYILSNPWTETVNYVIKEPVNRLRFHEFGGLPTFYINSKFVDTDGGNCMGDVDLYCATPAQQEESARLIKKGLDDCAMLAGRQTAFMDRHEKLAEGVYRTTYSDGWQVVVNLNDKDYCDGDLRVPAQDMIQVKE